MIVEQTLNKSFGRIAAGQDALTRVAQFSRSIFISKPMLRSKQKWYVLLFVSSLVLIWRLIDFADEVAYDGFHMTRGGFELKGSGAGVIEIAIILASIALIGKALKNLIGLQSAKKKGKKSPQI